MDKKIGFIGSGNMAGAMISGLIRSDISRPGNIMASNRTELKLENLKSEYNIHTTLDNKEVAEFADILVLSIKPNKIKEVINEIKTYIKEDHIIVSIVAGVSIESIQDLFQRKLKIARAMPNIPAIVAEGMTGLCHNSLVTENEMKSIVKIFNSFGNVEVLDEELMDVVTAVSASSPALVYMFIEALADGAVLKGLSREKAYRMVSQAVLGSAKMVLDTDCHPGQLKDRVCSAGGTTIEAIYSLEKKGFRGHVIEAIDKCTEKSIKLGRLLNDSIDGK